MEEINRNVLVREIVLKGQFDIKCVSGGNNECSHYRATIIFQRLLNSQNNYVIVPCENIEEVATGCSLDPIEILLEELSPTGIYQINTANAEAFKKDVELIKNLSSE